MDEIIWDKTEKVFNPMSGIPVTVIRVNFCCYSNIHSCPLGFSVPICNKEKGGLKGSELRSYPDESGKPWPDSSASPCHTSHLVPDPPTQHALLSTISQAPCWPIWNQNADLCDCVLTIVVTIQISTSCFLFTHQVKGTEVYLAIVRLLKVPPTHLCLRPTQLLQASREQNSD